MNTRIQQKLQEDKKVLSIYFTAGFPALNDTIRILESLEKAGVDMVEIGLPFSDPLADGPTIQASSTRALKNGMTAKRLFEQLKEVRKTVNIPLVLMGYFNPIFQYGVREFCEACKRVGIDGLIIPDLPVDVYKKKYQCHFEENGLCNILLITPQTSAARISTIDKVSTGFIYMVSSASVTGSQQGFGKEQTDYFKRIADMKLKNPLVVGFGISSHETFAQATKHTHGAIIGSAFIKHLDQHGVGTIDQFVRGILEA